MSSGFSARPLALGRLFSDPYAFQVPSFQRPYSWTTKEACQLLDDLTSALGEQDKESRPEDAGYFLGAMLLTEPGPGAQPRAVAGSAPRHDIIDGQQRLVTLTILLAVLRDLLAQSGQALPARLEGLIECPAAKGNQRHFRLELRGREREYFRTFVQEPGASSRMPQSESLTDAEMRILAVRERFLTDLGERSGAELFRISEFVAEACHVALISATSIDSAHRIFTVLNDRGRPLARNDILKAQILGQIEPQARLSALAGWDRTAELLGNDFEPLFSHIRAIEGRPKTQIIASINDVVAGAGGAKAFVADVLEPYGRAFHAIRNAHHEGSAHSLEIRRLLTYLGWPGSSDWVPPALLWWRLSGDDAERLVAFLRPLERLVYSLRLLGMGTDKRLARFQGVLHAVRSGSVLDGRNSPLQLTRDEQRNILYNLRSLHARSPLNCKLVLMRLNDELAGAPQHLDPADYTVEHVLPQKPARASAWRSWFSTAEEREACTGSIGNLVLVTRQQNERARNGDLARKLEVYFRTPGATVLHLTAELSGISQWRAPEVRAREERLLGLINSIWQLEGARPNEADPRGTALQASSRRTPRSPIR